MYSMYSGTQRESAAGGKSKGTAPEESVRRAREELEAGRYPSAITHVSEALDSPDLNDVQREKFLLLRAECYHLKPNYGRALDDALAALRVDSNSVEAHLAAGRAKLFLQNVSDALKHFTTAEALFGVTSRMLLTDVSNIGVDPSTVSADEANRMLAVEAVESMEVDQDAEEEFHRYPPDWPHRLQQFRQCAQEAKLLHTMIESRCAPQQQIGTVVPWIARNVLASVSRGMICVVKNNTSFTLRLLQAYFSSGSSVPEWRCPSTIPQRQAAAFVLQGSSMSGCKASFLFSASDSLHLLVMCEAPLVKAYRSGVSVITGRIVGKFQTPWAMSSSSSSTTCYHDGAEYRATALSPSVVQTFHFSTVTSVHMSPNILTQIFDFCAPSAARKVAHACTAWRQMVNGRFPAHRFMDSGARNLAYPNYCCRVDIKKPNPWTVPDGGAAWTITRNDQNPNAYDINEFIVCDSLGNRVFFVSQDLNSRGISFKIYLGSRRFVQSLSMQESWLPGSRNTSVDLPSGRSVGVVTRTSSPSISEPAIAHLYVEGFSSPVYSFYYLEGNDLPVLHKGRLLAVRDAAGRIACRFIRKKGEIEVLLQPGADALLVFALCFWGYVR